MFDMEHFLWERSGLGYSCFLNKDPSYVLNQSIAEFPKMIGYHQPAALSTNRTVYASYL